MKKCVIELVAAGVFAGLFVRLFLEAMGYSGQSGYMPLAATGLGVTVCGFWALESLRSLGAGQAEHFDVSVSDGLRFVLILAAGLIYVVGFMVLGALTATAIMVPTVAWALGYRCLKVIPLTTLGFTLTLWVVFRLLLAIPLPREAPLGLFGV